MIPDRGLPEAPDPVARFAQQFARGLGRAAGETREEVIAAVEQLGRSVSEGDVCLDLRRSAQGAELDATLRALRASVLVAEGEGRTPLVLDARGRLYLRRLWEDQRRLASALLERADAPEPVADRARLEASLARLFPGTARGDRQRCAARTALLRRLCVISGGPGTGKTHVVARLLALQAEQALARGARAPRAILLAPTGKAAVRLESAVAGALGHLELPLPVRAALPTRAQTLHRGLGLRADGSARFGRGAPLPAETVIVDEASLVDLALMARLADALAPDAKLVLLGDRDQLASVEAGAVLADLCGSEDRDGTGPGLAGCIVTLRESWRYPEQSGIGRLARSANAGDAHAVLELIADPAVADVRACEPRAELRARALEGYRYMQATGAAERLEAFERFRVICAHARGARGVEGVGAAIERELALAGRIAPDASGLWEGRPIAITRNDSELGLYNGDVGLLANHEGALRAFFPAAARAEGRWISPARLPAHGTAFAQTVHRSQGSEYAEVVVVLPEEASRVASRELLYTAITRARERVHLCASPEAIRHALARRSERSSGLAELLWGAGEGLG